MDMRGKYIRTEESKRRSSESRKKILASPDVRSEIALKTKRQWETNRDVLIAGIRKASNNDELRAKRSQAAKDRWKNPDFREKVIPLMSGENNANYNPDRSQILHRNGKGFLKSQVKRLLKPVCEWCGSDQNLQLDHILAICAGGDSSDDNAQTLCVKCNNKKRVTIDMVLMKSYRIRWTSLREDNTEPSSAIGSTGVCREHGVAPKGMMCSELHSNMESAAETTAPCHGTE